MVTDQLISDKKYRYGSSSLASITALGNMARSWLRSGRNRTSRVSTARRQRMARSRTLTRTRQRRRQVAGTGVTEQYDRKLIYRKKTMPRYKKRKWRAFSKKVNFIAEKELGSQTVVFNKLNNVSNQTPGNHIATGCYLYPGRATTVDYANDVAYMANLGNATNSNYNDGVSVHATTKYLFHSGILDITIQNRSSLLQGTTNVYGNECKMEVDLYEISIPKEATTSATSYTDIVNLLNTSSTQEGVIKDNNGAPSTTETAISIRGVTPWDLSYPLSRFKIKIWKKTKFMLNVNETVTYQVRDARRHTKMREQINSNPGFNIPGMTKTILIIGKLTPACFPIGSTDGTYTERLVIGMTRKYLFKYEGENDDRSLYIAQ